MQNIKQIHRIWSLLTDQIQEIQGILFLILYNNYSDQSSMAMSASQMMNTQYEEIITQQKNEINKLTGEIIVYISK